MIWILRCLQVEVIGWNKYFILKFILKYTISVQWKTLSVFFQKLRGTRGIMWRQFMRESLSFVAFVPLDSRSALRVSHGRFRSSLRSRSTLPASQLRLHSSPKVGLACITLLVIRYLFGLNYNFKALLNFNIFLLWLLYNLWASIIKLAYNIISVTYYVINLAQG